MRAGAIQLNAGDDFARNLETADRLVREAASLGAELIALPEVWSVIGPRETLRSGAQTLDGEAIGWARATASELGVDLVAGSLVERTGEADGRCANTSVHVGRDGEVRAVYRKIHLFDIEIDGMVHAESATFSGGSQIVTSALGDPASTTLGLTICFDLRFPELYRILALRGAEVMTVPSAFTLPTTRDHWEPLLRARAIENQVFVVAPNQIGEHPGGNRSGGRSMIVDPWGTVLACAPDGEAAIVAELDLDRGRAIRARLPTLARRRPEAYDWEGREVSTAAAEKRRVILDAAVRVFARQGFHTCRVSDIADEAGVAYGLVYHYFSSKEQMLDTLFLERWDVMLAAIAETDASDRPPREKLLAIASFIIESYRHDPDVMKVIIVEVTRAANTFGRTHLSKIRDAYDGIASIVSGGQRAGDFGDAITPEFAAQAFYGSVEQVLTGWIFEAAPVDERELERAKTMIVDLICDGLRRR